MLAQPERISTGLLDRYELPPAARPTVDETCAMVSLSSPERSAAIMVPASPRISWTRDTQSTPDCAKGRKAWERVI
jgi:hypothetical protein